MDFAIRALEVYRAEYKNLAVRPSDQKDHRVYILQDLKSSSFDAQATDRLKDFLVLLQNATDLQSSLQNALPTNFSQSNRIGLHNISLKLDYCYLSSQTVNQHLVRFNFSKTLNLGQKFLKLCSSEQSQDLSKLGCIIN